MAKYKVALVGFQSFDTREVEVPDSVKYATTRDILEFIFQYGQNDLQPIKNKRSVSSGDVIFFGDKLYKVDNIGFSEITAEALWDEVTFQVERRKRTRNEFKECNEAFGG